MMLEGHKTLIKHYNLFLTESQHKNYHIREFVVQIEEFLAYKSLLLLMRRNWKKIVMKGNRQEEALILEEESISKDEIQFLIQNYRQLFMRIKWLSLYDNQLDSEAVRSLLSVKFTNLKILNLHSNHINSKGAKIISAADFHNLTQLDLGSNNIGDSGLRCLLDGNYINLNRLGIGQNDFSDKGAQCLYYTHLRLDNLCIYKNYFTSEGVKYIVCHSFMKDISINLQQNEFKGHRNMMMKLFEVTTKGKIYL